MKRFSDFAKDEHQLDGDKISIDDVIEHEIVILAYRLDDSKYNRGDGKVLTIQFEINEKRYILFTGSSVLKKQLHKYENELPFLATIKKVNNYFTLT